MTRKPATPWLNRAPPGEKLFDRQLIAAASRSMASLCTALTIVAVGHLGIRLLAMTAAYVPNLRKSTIAPSQMQTDPAGAAQAAGNAALAP